ncbi:MAG: transglycosylase domain-containing protein [Candidatus Shapirobacteria bacterium]
MFKFFYYLGRPFYLSLAALFNFVQNFLSLSFQKFTNLILLIKKINLFRFRFRWLFLATFFTFLVTGFYGFYLAILKDLPSPEKLINRPLALTTKIYDRNGNLLYKIYREQDRTLIPLEEIPKRAIEATIAVEDREYWQHKGLSWRGILRAIKHNLTNPDKEPIGGSTITQQLVKNALLGSQKTWERKIKEVILSVLVEMRFSKEEILQMYFNEIPYGGMAYGIEEAAQKYFGKSVREVNLAEASLLAGLPAGPTRFSPFSAYPDLAKERQKQVLSLMAKSGYLTEQEEQRAAQEPLRFNMQNNSIEAPHFVFYVKDLLAQKWGEQIVEEGGLEVKTSLDLNLQKKVEKIIQEELVKAAPLGVSNGAALIIKPKTGEILAMVGSKDYYDFDHDGNVNVTLRPRPPGSAIKIITYSLALQNGFTPATIIPDTPITFQKPYQDPYSPQNYDGRFHGNVSLRTALASSFNVPAVKVLSALGVDRMISQGELMGITTWQERSRFGLSLTLGGGEIKMIDLAQAYAVLANLGEKVDLNPFLDVKPSAKEVLDPGVAFLLNDILSDSSARAQGFGLHSLLNISYHKVAVKTGTSNNLRDNWAIGYTPEFLVAVWVGNNDNRPMSRIASGITGATPIWRKITDLMLESYPETGWKKPGNVAETVICRSTGTLPCEGCPQTGQEYFLENTAPKNQCSPSWFLAEKDHLGATKNQ